MSIVPGIPPGQPTYLDPVPGIIDYGTFNLLSGPPGGGKTALLCGLLARIRDGKEIFGHKTNPPPAIGYICADRPWRTGARNWFEKAGLVEGPTLKVYSLRDDRTFPPTKLRNKLKLVSDLLKMCIDKLELPRGSLVNIDPVALFIPELNNYGSVAAAMFEIGDLLMAGSLTGIGICHTAKMKADKKARYERMQDSINGSTALHGYSDTQLHLAPPDKTDKPYQFLIHPHNQPSELHKVGRDPQGCLVPWTRLLLETDKAVYEAIPVDSTPVALATILEKCPDISRATVFRKLKALMEEGLLVQPTPGLYQRVTAN